MWTAASCPSIDSNLMTAPTHAAPPLRPLRRYGQPWTKLLRANMRRQLTLQQRNGAFVVIRIIQCIIMGVATGASPGLHSLGLGLGCSVPPPLSASA